MFIQKKNIYIDMQNQGDVNSASKVELVVLVYDRIIVEINKVIEGIAKKDIQMKSDAVSKAIKIIELGLLEYLDLSKGDIAENLKTFYISSIMTLTNANLRNEIKDLEKVKESFIMLKEAWKELSVKQAA